MQELSRRPIHQKRKAAIPANIRLTDSLPDSTIINWVSFKTSATTKIPSDSVLSLLKFPSENLVCVTRRYLEKKMA